ncbi:MAG: hypothetical protein WKG03_13320 [Telluria sp.]
MTLSFLRPAILIALAAASLAGCGGKATFEITGSVTGLKYPGLVLVETISGQTITINDITKTAFAFPNTIEYGTEYNVIVRATPSGQPPHQNCVPVGATSDSAGRRAAITMGFDCTDNPHTVGGSIKLSTATGSYVGLKLINGSNDLNPFVVTDATAQTSYAYPGVTFDTPYGIRIFSQPTDPTTTCQLVPKVATAGAGPEYVSGRMGDVDIVIDVVCAKA